MNTGNLLTLNETAADATLVTGKVLNISDATTGSGYGVYTAMTTSNNSGTALYVTNTSAILPAMASMPTMRALTGYAGYFNGNVNVTGNTSLNGTTTINGGLVVTGGYTGCTGGSNIAISNLTTALANNSFDNAAYTQTWSLNSLTTGNALVLSTSAVNTGNLLTLNETAGPMQPRPAKC